MATPDKLDERLLTGEHTNASVDKHLGDIVLDQSTHNQPVIKLPMGLKTSPWVVTALVGFLFVNLMLLTITVLISMGIGIWGDNQPV
ncbi:MAG: hypothetical protein IH945_06365, partial [Armatimonadetes bacterium]|nr:hypothetical protein [Armatimonadota bacterium]